ncbi:PQQ-dependent sugar dehydrogenase [Sorangium sp. So ce1000]|uniref:PQQ-dependent sugar dehydrogenase n=1 Tax=Sorangium sp. So ce1000 TaxID=3133325 RepID=UPI003F5D60D3
MTFALGGACLALGAGACGDDGTTSGDSTTSGGNQSSGAQTGSGAGAGSSTGAGAGAGSSSSSGAGAGSSSSSGAGGGSGATSSSGTTSGQGGAGAGGGDPVACDASAAPDVGKLALASVVPSLDKLVYAAQPPGSSDWYLVQQTGTIRVFSGGQLRSGAFLDVSSQITLSTGSFDDERGLISIAFPPDYATSGKFYVMMTATKGTDMNRDMVIEYKRSNDPFVADANSAKTIVRLDSSAVNHNGGHIVFGPDGMLYVGTGDGGGSCNSDKPGGSQDPGSLFGKILRLDPNAAEPYAAAGNPFDGTGSRVWHYGLRNPYSFSFDRGTGDLFIGDVGQDSYEEVDYVPAGTSGLNFGWPKWEGTHADTCNGRTMREGATHTPPIVDMDRRQSATGPFRDYKSVVSGFVYRGSGVPQLKGVYLFGDYAGGKMGALMQCGTQTSPVTVINKNPDPNAPNAPAFARQGNLATFEALTAIVEDNAGELYFVANRNSLLKIVPGT